MTAAYVGMALASLAIAALVTWYLYGRLVWPRDTPHRWRWIALILAWVLAGPVAMALRVLYGFHPLTVAANWIGWTASGLLFFFLAMLVIRDVGLLMFGKVREAQNKPIDPDRRQLFIRSSNAALGFATLAVGANGVRAARRTPTVVRVDVPVNGLPDAISELSIVQVSDLHVGDTVAAGFLDRVCKRVMELNPDIIVITGDLVDGFVDDIAHLLDPLDQLSAPLGVYYVTGNHEYYFNAEAWLAEVASRGIRTLNNEHVVISYRGHRLVLGGISDHDGGMFYDSHRPDVERAFAGAPEAACRLLLAHQPRSYPLAEGHRVDLQLSGHTHGGQIWPFGLFVPFQQYFTAGLKEVRDDRRLYISRGTGYWGPPMRVGAPSEITALRLVPSEIR